MRERKTRRKYLLTLGATSAAGLAGCSQTTSSEPETPKSENLSSAAFSFEYRTEENQISIQYDGGADIVAGDLQIRSSSGLEVQWPQLGSTVASPEDLIDPGATAVLGETILNWGEAMTRQDTVRLVHMGGDAPATLGRFSPPESSSEDTIAPSITGFSLSNPSGQQLRTSFESDEDLASIRVSISGEETVTLRTDQFSETDRGNIYTYEATYQASSNGEYTATLDQASDTSGNDGSSSQSATISVGSQSQSVIYRDDFDYDSYLSNWQIRDDHDGPGISIEIEDGQLIHTVDGNNNGGNIITEEVFDSDGILKLEVQTSTPPEGYGGFGIGFHFADYGTEGGVQVQSGSGNGFSYTVYPSDDQRNIDIDPQAPDDQSYYSMTIDCEEEKLIQATYGEDSYTLDADISGVYDSDFFIEIGFGRDHQVYYDYVELREM